VLWETEIIAVNLLCAGVQIPIRAWETETHFTVHSHLPDISTVQISVFYSFPSKIQ
jgi:hypothetical protein